VAADDPSSLFSSGGDNDAATRSIMRDDRLESTSARPSSGGERRRHPDAAHSFDRVLRKLETTKRRQHDEGVHRSSPASSTTTRRAPRTPSGGRRRATAVPTSAHDDSSYDDDSSSSDSRDDDRFFASDANDEYDDDENENDGSIIGGGSGSTNERQRRLIEETRQQFVDRQVVRHGPPNGGSGHDTVVDSFIVKQRSSTEEWRSMEGGEMTDNTTSSNLPSAILKLDQRLSIPAPMHKNDVLVEIEVRDIYVCVVATRLEIKGLPPGTFLANIIILTYRSSSFFLYLFPKAYTVDKKELMIRPGVRCTGDAEPLGVTTIGMDCIGHIVQLTNHARAVYGISVDDRVAAIYPFDYNTDDRPRRRNTKYALVDAGFVVAVPRDVDAADAACMIRLYVSAFQSILMGIGTTTIGSSNDRYGTDQLGGRSILIQNGHTEFGRALIQMAALLGASRIFATGPTECHALLSELGASPLGARTFSWELFIEEKIGLVLVQEMPTAGTRVSFVEFSYVQLTDTYIFPSSSSYRKFRTVH